MSCTKDKISCSLHFSEAKWNYALLIQPRTFDDPQTTRTSNRLNFALGSAWTEVRRVASRPACVRAHVNL